MRGIIISLKILIGEIQNELLNGENLSKLEKKELSKIEDELLNILKKKLFHLTISKK